jgi:hypothetical protein
MKYEIRVETISGSVREYRYERGPKKATKAAKMLASQFPNDYVYIQWFRSSDNQTGYLNPGENHEPTGKRW